MPRNRFPYGTHKRVAHLRGSQIDATQSGRYVCVSEKCGASAPSLALLGEIPHQCRQNHGPANQPRPKTSQRRRRRQHRRFAYQRPWDNGCVYTALG